MASLIATALGGDFEKLHPAVQERHSFDSLTGLYSTGIGVMDRVWSGSKIFTPFLMIGSRRNIMFPGSGVNVPFRIECWAYTDSFGRETLTLNRTYGAEKSRQFDEFLVAVPEAPRLMIYVGNHQHLAVEIDVEVSSRGGVEFRTGSQKLMTPLGPIRFPRLLSGSAVVHEWFDEDSGRFHIDARVRNQVFGDIFGTIGSYDSRLEMVPDDGIPPKAKPMREESRW